MCEWVSESVCESVCVFPRDLAHHRILGCRLVCWENFKTCCCLAYRSGNLVFWFRDVAFGVAVSALWLATRYFVAVGCVP